ncbi:hypothetical protein EDB84DRAFT_748482 [Lactarius hengduanensis]|nr:hypothetical protein EDB84DRAFT_748482 [Lactarius hengduanensis]
MKFVTNFPLSFFRVRGGADCSEQSIFFAFLRVFVDSVTCFATITYIPEGTYGLRKARTSVARPTVQSWFNTTSARHNVYAIALSSAHAQGPQATLTISHLEDLTASAIRKAMPFTPVRPAGMARTSSKARANREKTVPRAPGPVTRTASEPATYISMRGSPNFGDPNTCSELREAARRTSEAEDHAALRGASGAHQVAARRRGTKGGGRRGRLTRAARARPGAFGGDADSARGGARGGGEEDA